MTAPRPEAAGAPRGPVLGTPIPILRVSNGAAAEAFYVGRLGFRLEFTYLAAPPHPDPSYRGVSRDGAWLHLSSFGGDGLFGASVYLPVDDVDALFAEFRAKGIVIDLAPTDQTWNQREMYVRDPDGNCLRFATERQV
jgi:catechol 2,3-dioxygenase-like lactoylglutathione lyase family enzyme